MYTIILGALFGVVSSLYCFTAIPSLWYLGIALTIVALSYFVLPTACWRLILGMTIGSTYALLTAYHVLSWQLPSSWEGSTQSVVGTIIDLPTITTQYGQTQATFELMLQSQSPKTAPHSIPIRLNWYHLPAHTLLLSGQKWHLLVRLKRPHGLENPGGFDYERWLFAHHIRATGYVIEGHLDDQSIQHPNLVWIRQTIRDRIMQAIGNTKAVGLVIALIIGDQSHITPAEWQVMRATGTNHLMAIAGLHIGFVSGFVFLLTQALWRKIPNVCLYLPTQHAAMIAAWISAALYSALAGFALPTERALVMLGVMTYVALQKRHTSLWQGLFVAIAVLLILDPLSTLEVSFWLSCATVACILYGIGGRLHPSGWWWRYGRVQWVISLGLTPLSLLLFQQTALLAFCANSLAIPVVGFCVLPLCLVGAVSLFLYPPIAKFLLSVAAYVLDHLWSLLSMLSQLPFAIWYQPLLNPWIFGTTVIGILLILAPKGFPGKMTSFLWLTPILFYRPIVPPSGAMWLTLLDVGQGLSAVIQTHSHNLIFDTGPPFGLTDDAGQRVVLPFLRSQGIHHIDMLMISHGDNDHSGGALSILKQIPTSQLLTSVPERFPRRYHPNYCQAGQSWQWDDVRFRVLYPTHTSPYQGNNSSCVLKIETPANQGLLLTGDIEKPAENTLVSQESHRLMATVLVAPHHGSRTSSSLPFVQSVSPRYVLMPTGYLNRFHFPNPQVVQRYQAQGANVLNTAQTGAIQIHLPEKDSIPITVHTNRERHHLWNANRSGTPSS